AAYIPSRIAGMPAGDRAWGGYAAGRAGSITRAPALPGRRWPVPGRGQYVARPRARLRARSRSCGLSRAAGAADVPVAHAVEDQGEQFASGGDLGGVPGFLAAAGDNAVLDLPRPGARGLPLDRLAHCPAQHPRALPGHVPPAHLEIGLAVPRGQPGPAAQLPGTGEPADVADPRRPRLAPGRYPAAPGSHGIP